MLFNPYPVPLEDYFLDIPFDLKTIYVLQVEQNIVAVSVNVGNPPDQMTRSLLLFLAPHQVRFF